jgi:radical SAM superfamily enzyme YgiQ (UPF0313 family)
VRSVLLISTYDMGRQPFGLASPAAWLRDAGATVVCADLAKERLPDEVVRQSDVIAFFLPMHTATRLALPVIDRVRGVNPQARLAAYGLYAPLNEALLRARGVTDVLGGEFEEDLVHVCMAVPTGSETDCNGALTSLRQGYGGPPELQRRRKGAPAVKTRPEIPRLQFRVPLRTGLPPLTRYATLQVGAERRITGYTEASRGCKHRCRHCPIVPVYDGRFRVVPAGVVLADIRAQVEAGARHLTFGDPDFFNGIRHAEAIVQGFAREFPGLTYDVTIKVEHVLQHAGMLPVLRDTGCAFVTSAVESLDDEVLARLEKGHTRRDFERMVALFRDVRLPLAATFVAFTPWTTLESYLELLHTIDRLDLVESVSPIQLAIRLLVPQGSRMVELPDMCACAGAFDPISLTHPWTHPNPAVDALQARLSDLVGVRLSAPRSEVFAEVWDAAHAHADVLAPLRREEVRVARAAIPYLNEPWYC